MQMPASNGPERGLKKLELAAQIDDHESAADFPTPEIVKDLDVGGPQADALRGGRLEPGSISH